MKRDPELFRALLIDIEEAPSDMHVIGFSYEEDPAWDQAMISHHMALLEDAGLITYSQALKNNVGIPIQWALLRLTNDGHDFLDAARNPGIWKKALASVGDKGLGIGLDLFKELLKSLMKQELGL